MDANRQRFWMLADAGDWTPAPPSGGVEYDTHCRRLRLRDRRPARTRAGLVEAANVNGVVATPSWAVDAWGTVAFWDEADGTLRAAGGVASPLDSIPLWVGNPDVRIADLAMGFDDVLFLAMHRLDSERNVIGASLGFFDPRGRWRNPRVVELPLEGFTPHRLTPRSGGGVWALDRDARVIGGLAGLPLREGLPPQFSPTVFRPVPENPRPPEFRVLSRQPDWADGEDPVALSASASGRLAVISWREREPDTPPEELEPNAETWLRILEPDGRWGPARRLMDAGQATSVAWLSDTRLVVFPAPRTVGTEVVQPREAIAYDPDDEGSALHPVGGFLPARQLLMALFLKGPGYPPLYLDRSLRPRRLHPLSVATYQPRGVALGRVLDAGVDQAVWHRVYLEGVFPPRCGVILDLAASDDPDWSPETEEDWHPHLFGDTSELAGDPGPYWALPARGVWLPDRSEIPHHAGLLCREPERERAGLFTALAQRPGRSVRRLQGRYLSVRARLAGTGHTTPEIAAVRVYASRFSYRDAYLPEVYHEERFGADADTPGRATGPDFLERLLALFESVLTPLEDRVAAAQILMDPTSTPEEALEWLGSWIGVVFEPSFPADRRRAWLEAAPQLFRARGTLAGVQLALEIATGGRWVRGMVDGRERSYATGGGVTGGEVIVLEDFRLRRTFATLLGVNLSVSDDPLLPGLIVSANSRVGDTLFIGELSNAAGARGERTLGRVEAEELLALFRDLLTEDAAQRLAEEEAVRRFYGRLANRATIFVHNQAESVDLGLLERIAAAEAPAHVAVRVVTASHPLLVGIASLVDVDTYLGPRPFPRVAEVERSRIGEGDFIRSQGALDARLGGLPAPLVERPVARIDGPSVTPEDATLTLDGSASSAPPGSVVERYLWTLVAPEN